MFVGGQSVVAEVGLSKGVQVHERSMDIGVASVIKLQPR